MTEQTEQEKEMFEYLVEDFGLTPREAKLRMEQDADLWIVRPEMRFAAEGEEAVEAWSEAVRTLNSLQEMAASGALCANRAVLMCIWDAEERAKIALERARQRMPEAAE